MGFQDAQQYLVKVLSVKYIIACKGFVHQDILRTLAQRQNDLKLVLLTGGEAADGLAHGQFKKVHQGFKPLSAELGKLAFIEDPVIPGIQIREKGVLTGGKGQLFDIFVIYFH